MSLTMFKFAISVDILHKLKLNLKNHAKHDLFLKFAQIISGFSHENLSQLEKEIPTP